MIHEIKLIGIHKRNLQILESKRAHFGADLPMHFQNQIDAEKARITEHETILHRRLQALLEKLATYGLSADPSISMEVEDIQAYFEQNKQTDTPKFI